MPLKTCKRGDSLPALQRAGMLEPAPADSNSSVWYTGGVQTGFCIMSDKNPARKFKGKIHGIVCVHKLSMAGSC